MFSRQVVEEIKNWYHRKERKPLVIRGARQVGKTTAVRLAASQLSVDLVEINLERHPELDGLFRLYRLDELLFNFALISGREVGPDRRLILFLDEAQATPAAYSCLRYFYEEMPGLAVVLTGSLLDQVLDDDKLATPVGRVEHCYMGPLGFDEFLSATGQQSALAAIGMLRPGNMHLVPDSLHEELLGLVRRYTLIGGMPYCVRLATGTGVDHAEIVRYQTMLVQAYKDDFAKYAGSLNALKLNAFFSGMIAGVGRQFSHKMANDIAGATSGDYRQLNAAIESFQEARLFHRVLHSVADAVPLGGALKPRMSKFLFVDIGLLLAAQGIQPQAVMGLPLELSGRGVLAEQFVGQQLLNLRPGYVDPSLYYWHPPKSEGQAEIDFLFESGNRIYPVEVKSGERGSIKSLHSFMLKKHASLAVRVSSLKPSLQQLIAKSGGQQQPFTLIDLPFYLVNQLDRFLAES